MSGPERVVQRQLDAYNARDLEAWLATYHPEAVQRDLQGQILAQGREAIRSRMQDRFADSDLHAELISRIRMGSVVVDHERVTRPFHEGLGTVEMLCIYEIDSDLIMRATFALGPRG
jgi:hypothetical protein